MRSLRRESPSLMNIAVGTDMPGELPEALGRWLDRHGHTIVRFGALKTGAQGPWPGVARDVGEAVARGQADYGILCCWTGTGVSIVANKVRGVRAALCADAATAAGAREWNDANVLCLSLRATAPAIGEEILAAWFSAEPTKDPAYRAMIDEITNA
jgi:ribose 5-phosphate isomerase B